jgi:hypothetical protein
LFSWFNDVDGMKEKKKEVRGLWGCWRLEKESSGWFVEDEGDEGAEG